MGDSLFPESGIPEKFPAASVAWPLRQDWQSNLKGEKFQFHDPSRCIAHFLAEVLMSSITAKSA